MGTAQTVAIPEGFELETQTPPLPEGFELEKPSMVPIPDGFELEQPQASFGKLREVESAPPEEQPKFDTGATEASDHRTTNLWRLRTGTSIPVSDPWRYRRTGRTTIGWRSEKGIGQAASSSRTSTGS